MIKYTSKIFDEYDTLFYNVEYSKSGRPKAVLPAKPVEPKFLLPQPIPLEHVHHMPSATACVG